MEFSIKTLAPERAKTGCLVLGVYQGGALTRAAQHADRAARGALRSALALGDLTGKPGSTLLLRELPGLAAQRVLLVGLGERKDFGEQPFRDAVRGAANALRELGAGRPDRRRRGDGRSVLVDGVGEEQVGEQRPRLVVVGPALQGGPAHPGLRMHRDDDLGPVFLCCPLCNPKNYLLCSGRVCIGFGNGKIKTSHRRQEMA